MNMLLSATQMVSSRNMFYALPIAYPIKLYISYFENSVDLDQLTYLGSTLC